MKNYINSNTPFGLAIPDYSDLKVPESKFAENLWGHLQKMDEYKIFSRVPIKLKKNPDGTQIFEVEENVRGKTIYILNSFNSYTLKEPSLLFVYALQMLDALRRAHCEKTHVVELFNPFFRQDSRTENDDMTRKREDITASLIAGLYNYRGARDYFSADPHSKQVEGFFEEMEVIPLSKRLAKYLRQRVDLTNAMLFAPDAGGTSRAEKFDYIVKLPFGAVYKTRISPEFAKAKYVLGNPRGKDIVIREDQISTAGTIVEEAILLRKKKAKRIITAATHLQLCKDAKQRILDNDIEVIGTNTIEHEFTPEESKNIHVVDVSDIIASVLYHDAATNSVTSLYRKSD